MNMSSKRTNYDFMGKGKYAICLSLAVIIYSIFIVVQGGKSLLGTDYVGGFEFVVQLDPSVDNNAATAITKALKDKNFEEVVVQSYEIGSGKYAVRTPGVKGINPDDKSFTGDNVKEAKAALTEAFADKYELLSNVYIGPVIGQELLRKAMWAFIFSLLGIIAYITYRFEFAFALGAVVAVFHDAIVVTGIYLALGHEISMMTLAAVLTIVGYSVNDTIVIFDRVREEIFKRKDYDLVPLMNECINATLSRTIITTFSTLLAAGSLLLWGGGAIRDLSLFMVIGLIVGTYSTIFIASPVVVFWEWFMTRKSRKAAKA